MTRALVVLLAVVALGTAGSAAASPSAPLTWATACSADLDVATCERLTWIANSLDARGDGYAAIDSAGDASSSGSLSWWGTWAIVGLLIALLIAPMWHRAFGFEDKGV